MAELLFNIEDEFDLKLPDVPLDLATFGDVVRYVDEQIAAQQACLRYIDDDGAAAERYPQNPNGSPDGLAGLTTDDGRATILMPHPERVYLSRQFSWLPREWRDAHSPWFRMFANARQHLG